MERWGFVWPVLGVRWGFLWLLYFHLQKVEAEWVHPILYLRSMVEEQQSGACLRAQQHPLVTTAVEWDLLRGWPWHRQKVRAGDGTCFRICPGHKQPQAAEASFHEWPVADWEQRGEPGGSCPLLFCPVQAAGISVVVLGPARIFMLSGCRDEKRTDHEKDRWWSCLGGGAWHLSRCELWGCALPGGPTLLVIVAHLTKNWIICCASITTN